MHAEIRKLVPSDLPEAIFLWSNAPGVELREWETREHLEVGLVNGTLLGVVAEEQGHVVGAVLVGHDGVRSYVHHFACSPDRGDLWLPSALIRAGVRAAERWSPSRRLLMTTGSSRGADVARRYGFADTDERVLQLDFDSRFAGDYSVRESEPPGSLPELVWRKLVQLERGSKLAGGALVVLVVLGAVLTFEVKPDSILGRAWAAMMRAVPEEEQLPEAQRDDAGSFRVRARRDVLDLDVLRYVPLQPVSLVELNVSPALREVTLWVERARNDATEFHLHSQTAGARQDLVCLSGNARQTREVVWPYGIGNQFLEVTELPVDASQWPVGQVNVVKVQLIGWNKYRTSEHGWASVFAEHETDLLEFWIDFPAEAGVRLEELVFRKRELAARNWTALEVEPPDLELDAGSGLMKWRVGRAQRDEEYGVFWSRELVTAPGPEPAPTGTGR